MNILTAPKEYPFDRYAVEMLRALAISIEKAGMDPTLYEVKPWLYQLDWSDRVGFEIKTADTVRMACWIDKYCARLHERDKRSYDVKVACMTGDTVRVQTYVRMLDP